MKYLINILLFFISWNLQAQLVLTVAGVVDSVGNYDGPVYEATFNNPHGIAVDQYGNIYTADRYSHTIRKITTDGMVETLAGQNGITGSQDGDASISTFNEPWGLCVDLLGNVIVADTRNNKIRRISPDGIVSTVAGNGNFGVVNGAAEFSAFGNPTGVECDTNGIIYVADHLTHTIRKIDTDGTVSTIAGTPYLTGSTDGPATQATFNRPYGLTLDLDGNILIADEWNHKIRMIDQNGNVSTLAGSGVLGSSDGIGSEVSFNYPWDMTVDENGNIFVADGYNNIIRKIFPNGNVITYVGTAENSGATDGVGALASFNGATSIAINEATQEIYVGDAYNNLVRKIIDLNQSVILVVTNGQTTICEGEVFEIDASPQVFSNYDFFLDDVLVQSGIAPTYSTTNLTPGLHAFKVTANDGSNSSVSGEVLVSVIAAPTPTITALGATTFYEGDSLTLEASEAVEYLWSTGATTPYITVYESGSYSVVTTDENGCTGSSEELEIIVEPFSTSPLISIDGNTTLCAGGSTQLTSNYPSGNQWLKDGTVINGATNTTFTVTEAGLYQVQVLDEQENILTSNTLEIFVLKEQIVDFMADQTVVEAGNTIQFTAITNGDLDYLWSIDGQTSTEEQPTFTLTVPGIYPGTLTTSDANCNDILTKTAYIEVLEAIVLSDEWFVPNAFSPNGDGYNDQFLLRGNGLTKVKMAVYNQWGELVFESSDQSLGWNGMHHAKPAQIGTYVYLISFLDQFGEAIQASGHITLLR